jgi:hypothetical protein
VAFAVRRQAHRMTSPVGSQAARVAGATSQRVGDGAGARPGDGGGTVIASPGPWHSRGGTDEPHSSQVVSDASHVRAWSGAQWSLAEVPSRSRPVPNSTIRRV